VWYHRDTPCENCPAAEARDSGKPVSVEKELPNGLFWQVRLYPVLDNQGVVTGLVEFAWT
jgi:hypothetical protein